MTWLHRIAHLLGLNIVVPVMKDREGELWAGYRCCDCGKTSDWLRVS